MTIQLPYLNSFSQPFDWCHIIQNNFLYYGLLPLGGSVQCAPPSICFNLENIGLNHCLCQNSALYLNWCTCAPPPTNPPNYRLWTSDYPLYQFKKRNSDCSKWKLWIFFYSFRLTFLHPRHKCSVLIMNNFTLIYFDQIQGKWNFKLCGKTYSIFATFISWKSNIEKNVINVLYTVFILQSREGFRPNT